MVSRFLDWLDESAAGVIRIAYLLAGVIAVASYFSDGNVPPWLTHDLDAILPWVLAGALEIHTYLSARRVRAAYQDIQAATLGSDEHERAERSMRINLWILGGLLVFSMYNQLQYLAANWTPPHTPLTPPGPLAYLVRAIITPAAFMAAAFLAPMGEGMAVQVKREASNLARLAFKAASQQWKRRLRDMQRSGQDVTAALVQLVDDPTERRVIASIHAAMHPTVNATTPAPVTLAPVDAIQAPQDANLTAQPAEMPTALPTEPAPVQSDAEPPKGPPTGGGSPIAQPVRTPRRKAPAILRLEPPPESRKAAAQASGRGVRTPRVPVANFEPQAREAWAAGARSIPKMKRATGMSHSAAQSWVRTLKAEAAAMASNPSTNQFAQ